MSISAEPCLQNSSSLTWVQLHDSAGLLWIMTGWSRFMTPAEFRGKCVLFAPTRFGEHRGAQLCTLEGATLTFLEKGCIYKACNEDLALVSVAYGGNRKEQQAELHGLRTLIEQYQEQASSRVGSRLIQTWSSLASLKPLSCFASAHALLSQSNVDVGACLRHAAFENHTWQSLEQG